MEHDQSASLLIMAIYSIVVYPDHFSAKSALDAGWLFIHGPNKWDIQFQTIDGSPGAPVLWMVRYESQGYQKFAWTKFGQTLDMDKL